MCASDAPLRSTPFLHFTFYVSLFKLTQAATAFTWSVSRFHYLFFRRQTGTPNDLLTVTLVIQTCISSVPTDCANPPLPLIAFTTTLPPTRTTFALVYVILVVD